MNILPKKKWHVRTKENIERVRRDEAKAAEEEQERERRQRLAEQEARTSLLRSRARTKHGRDSSPVEESSTEAKISSKQMGFEGGGEDIDSITGSSGHVNFFQNLENGENLEKGNDEHAAEKKKEQEEYEKKVGYLTYLGQDTEELTGEKVWWRKLPDRHEPSLNSDSAGKVDVGNKQKNFLDPIRDVKKYLGCEHESLSLKKYVKSETSSQKRKRSPSPSPSKQRKKRKKEKNKLKKVKKSSSKKSKKRKRKYSSSSDSSDSEKNKKQKSNLAKLRKERLDRERKEREKANRVLHGEPAVKKSDPENVPTLKQTYSSQFNPEIARQNKLDAKKKYWLE